MAAPRDWDGARYDRIADPMTRWGTDVLDRLPLAGDETVLDAGCGSGRVTERLLERLPRGRVVALDASPSMVETARGRLERFGDRVEYHVGDLGRPLPLAAASVDAVLSTATFHWVADHDALFANLAMVLRPGGRLVAQCGGAGNIRSVVAAIRATGDSWDGPWTFATSDETRRRLETAAFGDVEAWLNAEPTAIEPGEPLREYLRTVILGAHLDRLPEGDRDAFVDDIAARLPTGVIDYVRLNILATRNLRAGIRPISPTPPEELDAAF
jgi:trans-aconitate 2-methyltransferase